jgi:hypothetical protein
LYRSTLVRAPKDAPVDDIYELAVGSDVQADAADIGRSGCVRGNGRLPSGLSQFSKPATPWNAEADR